MYVSRRRDDIYERLKQRHDNTGSIKTKEDHDEQKERLFGSGENL